MSSLRRVRRLAGLANRRSNRRSNRLASPRALGATPIRQDLPHHPVSRAHKSPASAHPLHALVGAASMACIGGAPAAASAVVGSSRRARSGARGGVGAASAVGSRKALGGVVVAAPRRQSSPAALRAVASTRAAIADGPAASASVGARKNAFSQADEYRRLVSEGHNLVPLYRRIFDDQLTPILAYRCLVQEDERDAPSFLLESVVGGTQTGRYSFLGSRPYMEVRLRPTPSPRPSRIAPRGTARTRARYLSPPSRTRTRSRDRSIDRASRRLRSRRLGVFHSPTDLPAAAPASRPATRAAHRRPLFVPRPLSSPRSPPRR